MTHATICAKERLGHSWKSSPPPLEIPVTDHEWSRFNEDLASYGCSVLTAWILNGSIFSRVYNLTRIRLSCSTNLHRDPDCASEVAGVTVAVALNSFRTLIEARGWNPDMGASLRTFFIGQCLMKFPNEYRRWVREYRADVAACEIPPQVELPAGDEDPAHQVILYMEALSALSDAPDRTRTVLAHTALGYSHQDIAKRIGTTAKGVEMIVYRYRRRTSPRRLHAK